MQSPAHQMLPPRDPSRPIEVFLEPISFPSASHRAWLASVTGPRQGLEDWNRYAAAARGAS